MNNQDKLMLAHALFAASAGLTEGWHGWNDPNVNPKMREAAQASIEAAQDEVQAAIKFLGGVDYLHSIGA